MINKNAYLRYIVLDRCFRNFSKKYTIDVLLNEVNKYFHNNNIDASIQKRQLYEDIKFMKSDIAWAIPLEKFKNGRTTFYRYSDKEFSIKNQKISKIELETIYSSLLILSDFEGLPQIDWLKELMAEFQLSNKKIISFQKNENLKGLDFLFELYKDILNEQFLKIKYKEFFSDVKEFDVFPFFLKQYNNRWFLISKNIKENFIQSFALDRIVKVKTIDSSINVKSFNQHGYFKNIVGVSKDIDSKLLTIELFVAKKISPYLLTNKIHTSQKIIKKGKRGITVELKLIPNLEFQELLKSYGENIELLSPDYLKNTIYNSIHKKYNFYQMKTINNNNVKLHFIEKKNNNTNNWVLFIPGAINSAEQIFEDLENADFNFYILSLRGRGKSDSPKENYTLQDQASDIIAFINDLDANIQLSVFAHSVGVPISIMALYNLKREINTFFMCEFAPFYPPFDKNWADILKKKKVDSISEIAINGIVKDSRYIDVSKELKQIKSKIILLVGNNKFSALRQKEKNALLKIVPTLDIIEIRGGHDLLNENIEESLKIIEEYI